MSMTSAQIDKMRTYANKVEGTFPMLTRVMREAADTILELRDDLQRANVENAKLRNGYGSMSREHSQTIVELSDAYYSIDQLKAENAKLRELVRGLHMAYVGALNECEGMDAGLIWDHCEMVDAELAKSHARFEADRHRFDVAMRELGVGG